MTRPVPAMLMSEAELESNVRAYLADLGLWGYHPRVSTGSQPGWPDWCILGPRGALFRELKRERGVVSPDQRAVGARMGWAGLNWAVWRPMDLYSGAILKQLMEIV